MQAEQAEVQKWLPRRGVNAIKGNEHYEAFADPRDLFYEQNEFSMYEKEQGMYHELIIRAQPWAQDLQPNFGGRH